MFPTVVFRTNQEFPRVGLLSTFYPETYGGAEVSLGMLLEGFQASGLDPLLFTLGHSGYGNGVIPISPLNHIPRRVKILGSPAFDTILARLVAHLISRNHLDILHVQDTYSLPGAIKAAQAVDIPVILSYHNDVRIPHSSFGAPYPFNVLLDFREEDIIDKARNCDLIVSNSNYTARRLIALGHSPSKVRSIYVGGAIRCKEHPPSSNNHEDLHVLAVGRLISHKGFQNLLIAAKMALSDGISLKLIIAGDGPQRKQLSRLAIKLGITDSAGFVGRTGNQQLLSLYDWSDVVVVPSITPEAFGRVAVEAMSRGKAVIGSNAGGLPEVVIDGETGFLVPPDSATDIAEKMKALGNNRNLACEMGRRGLERCKLRFDYELITGQLLDVYRSLTSNS